MCPAGGQWQSLATGISREIGDEGRSDVAEERVLTSEEHDALVAGMASGAIPEVEEAAGVRQLAMARKNIKEYDFRRPEKFSRDQLRTLQGIHDQWVRLLNSSLAGYLRTSVQFNLERVEQSSYEEFATQTKEGNLIYVISLEPLPAPILLEVSLELVFASLDRLLGGSGKRLLREREATEMERALFQDNWLMPVLDNLETAWQTIVSINPSVSTVETNASFVQIALPTDVCVSVHTTVAIGDAEGIVRVCYTYATLEPIVPQLDTQRLIAAGTSRRREDDTVNVRRGLNAINVPVSVRLGSAEVTFEELLGLQRGDVVRLDSIVDNDIDVLINGEVKYQGRPGLKRHRLAVRISRILDDDDDDDRMERSSVPSM